MRAKFIAWEDIVKQKIIKYSDGEVMFNLTASVITRYEYNPEAGINNDDEEVNLDARTLHGLAEDVLQELLGKEIEQEFTDEEGNEYTVTCKIDSVTENR